MKLIIAGSRNIKDYLLLLKAIKNSKYENITEVVSGCATGADELGEIWALQNNIHIEKMPAEWNIYGKSAGPRRNAKMGEYADAAIVLWDGVSKGSRHMIEVMNRLNKPVYIQMTLDSNMKNITDFFGE